MLDYYKKHFPIEKFPESRYEETLLYLKNTTLIAIIFKHSKRIKIPEWEVISDVSFAFQNMWLSYTALNYGAYWTTNAATNKYCDEVLELQENEKSLRFFIWKF